MNIQSYVDQQNKERADSLYRAERSKTQSERYLDSFKAWNDCVRERVKRLTALAADYEKRGEDFATQVPFITPHINILKGYAKAFEIFMENLKENIGAEQSGRKVRSLLKMRDMNNLEVFFEGLAAEINFVDLILAGGAFDVATKCESKFWSFFKGKEKQR